MSGAADTAQGVIAAPAMTVADTPVNVLPCGKKPVSVEALKSAKEKALVDAKKAKDGLSDDAAKAVLAATKAANRETALKFFAETMKDSKDNPLTGDAAEALLDGIDLSLPVEIVELPPPDTVSQYVRKANARVGNWVSPIVDQTGDAIGLNTDPAVRQLVTLPTPKTKALKSTAAPILDSWTDPAKPALLTQGGGQQITLPDAARDELAKKFNEMHPTGAFR